MSEKLSILTSLTYMRAQLLSAMLENNGIPGFINSNKKNKSDSSVLLYVYEKDKNQAQKILKQFKETYGENKSPAVDYMRSVRRILVPVDFTLHSENAAIYALQVASVLKADIKLVNAYLDPMGTPQTYLESYAYQLNLDKVIREVEEETEKSLLALMSRMKNWLEKKKLGKVGISFEMFKGSAVNAIMGEIENYKPGLLVIGTRGSELEGFRAFGSVTASLINKLEMPMLVVPKEFDATRFRAPKKVLFASNFDQADFFAVQRLASLAAPFKSKIYYVHAAQLETIRSEENQMKMIKDELAGLMDISAIEFGILETVDIQQGLEDFISERKIDVLAMTRHNRNFLIRIFKPSLTKKFLFQSHIPLLIFQAEQ